MKKSQDMSILEKKAPIRWLTECQDPNDCFSTSQQFCADHEPVQTPVTACTLLRTAYIGRHQTTHVITRVIFNNVILISQV